MSNILPDEILSEILSPALKVSDELFSDTSDVSPFSDYSPSTSAYLLVCKDWLRVATPLLYNVVVLRSKAQANALEKVLRSNPAFGRFIKKLRVEGGYGMAMHIILKSAPNITDLFISLAIWSSDGTQGLCKGLPLIDPHRVIVVDPQQYKPLKNKHLSALLKVLFGCIRTWDNLRVFSFPYCYRTEQSCNLAHALAQSPTIHTILLSEDFSDVRLHLCDSFLTISSLRALQFKKPLWRYAHEHVLSAINSRPRLKELMCYAVADTSGETDNPSLVPDIAPSLNPSFSPMESASDETRESVWKRVLFFAMYVEDLRSPSFPRKPSKSHPSRLPILCVSKYFNRLALPHLYDSLKIRLATALILVNRLEDRPDLGSFIKCMFIETYGGLQETAILPILSRATNLQKISGIGTIAPIISANVFEVLARTSGSSLREFSNYFQEHSTISMSVFAHLTELRVLELRADWIKFVSDLTLENSMDKLHTLSIGVAWLEPFTAMRLASLHTLELPEYVTQRDWPMLVKLLKAHKNNILHLSIAVFRELRIYDICKKLVDIEFNTAYDIADLTCETPHESLATIVADSLAGDPETLDPTKFPALRKIQIQSRNWPTTERDISKSDLVKMAEALLKKNITLVDSSGKGWIPRVKSTRKKR